MYGCMNVCIAAPEVSFFNEHSGNICLREQSTVYIYFLIIRSIALYVL